MEIDITSVVIGLASLATFAIPIGYDQLKGKRTESRAKQQFLSTSANIGFQHGQFDLLRNQAVIGIGKNNEELLYVKDSDNYSLVELRNITSCQQYKSQKKVPDGGNSDQTMKEIGLRINHQNGNEIKLPVFEGRDGTQRGDESIVVESWMSRIIAARNKLEQGISN